MPGIGWENPISVFHVTHFTRARYTMLALTLPHAICDGHSTAMFLRYWNDIACGREPDRPNLDFRGLNLPSPQSMINEYFANEDLDSQLGEKAGALQADMFGSMKTHIRGVFELKGDQVKRVTTRLRNDLKNLDSPLTTSEMVFGLIAAASLRRRKDNGVLGRFIVNMRRRSEFYPDDNYIGNAVAKVNLKDQIEGDASQLTTYEWLRSTCETMHRMVRRAINDVRALNAVHLAVELGRIYPSLQLKYDEAEVAEVIESRGFSLNSWKQFEECFEFTMGGDSKPIFYSTSPRLKVFVIPRMCLVHPLRPDGSLYVIAMLTTDEVDAIKSMWAELE